MQQNILLKFVFFEILQNLAGKKKPNLQIMIFIIAISFRLGDNYNIFLNGEFSKFYLPKMSKIKEIASQ